MPSNVYKRGTAVVGFNMTPMIDCTFQLIIFFMLTTQIASQDIVKMEVPRPVRSVAKEMKENKAIVNVVPYSDSEIAQDPSKRGLAKRYQVKAARIGLENTQKLIGLLQQEKGRSPEPAKFAVEVRADKRIQYSQIQPILQALQSAEMEKMRITAIVVGREE